jgi:spore germination cell wall hydrolase CwlJ-like protein
MAELGRRELTNDPLAITGREQRPERPLALQGVRPPNNGDVNAAGAAVSGAMTAMDGLNNAIGGIVAAKRDEAISNGKIAYMSGITEQEMLKNGDRHYETGYRTLQARDTVNNWFTNESIGIEQSAKTMDPDSYRDYLNNKRKSLLDGITDPNAKRVAAAAFEELSPRLAQNQIIANNKNNLIETQRSFTDALGSTAQVSSTASRLEPGQYIPTTPQPVAPPMTLSAQERDVAIKTVLGEAAGEGADGMAAVAHVLRNRAGDNRYPSSIGKVALQDKQFSVWNNGGESMRGFVPGSPLYEKAASIVDAVMQGRHVDPTGGATHYYAPQLFKAQTGKDKPDWWDGESKGQTVKVGGHVFAGKASLNSKGAGELVASGGHVNLSGLDKSLDNVLRGTAGVMGGKLVISSGFRDPSHPVEAAKGTGGGEHTHGTAADIDMSSMDEQQRKQLVRELAARGAKRFGTYANHPNMLHVDLKDQTGKGSNWFMYNKSNSNMGAAPAWFKEVSQEQPGQGAAQAGHSGTEVQGFIRGFQGLPPEVKSASVADAMRRRLDAGDPSLFNDAGGISILHELGAQPGDIDEVLKAKQRYDAKQQDKFSVERETYRNDILSRAEKGEDLQAILQDIEKNTGDSGILDDTAARSLAATAADRIRAEARSDEKTSKLANVDMLNEIGGLYQQIKTGNMDFQTAATAAQTVAAKYGATEADVKQVTAQMFQIDQSYKDGLRRDAEERSKKYGEQVAKRQEVDRAISQGYGLGLASGEIIVKTPTGDQKMSATEYGVAQIKDRWTKLYSDQVQAGAMPPEQAKGEVLRKVYLELQNHDVVDKEARAQIVGGLSGNILDPNNDKGLKDGALQAYDAWLTLKTTQGLKPGYLAKMVDDDYVRSLLETAYTLDAGDLSKEQALMKAHEILNDPNRDPAEKANKDAVWLAKRDKMIGEKIREALNPGFFGSLFMGNDQTEINRALSQSKTAENYVNARADAYHLQNPNEDAQVSLEKSIQDLQNNSSIIAGNLITTRPGQELPKLMGVAGFGPRAADEAVKDYVRDYVKANPDSAFAKKYAEKTESYAGAAFRTGPFTPVAPRDPELLVTFNPAMGTMSIDVYEDAAKSKAAGAVQTFFVKDIGKRYAYKRNQPTEWDKTWNTMFEGAGAFMKDIRDRNATMQNQTGASAAGAAIGGMFNK